MPVSHFDLPFRWTSQGHAAEAEQDTLQDVSNCVEAVLLTFKGQRIEMPEFGIDDPTFENQPIRTPDILQDLTEQEPRAIVLMDQHPDQLDQLLADVTAKVSTYPEVSGG